MNEKLWDEERGIYNAYDLRNEEIIPCSYLLHLMPCVGRSHPGTGGKMLLTLESELFGGKRRHLPLPHLQPVGRGCGLQKYWRGRYGSI